MTKLKGTQTEKNLLKSFAGESQARNRYTYFASVAKKEGYQAITAVFEETANHEKEHAKRLFKFLEDGGDLEITATYPAGRIGNTAENLMEAMNGEHEENTSMYPNMAKVAREEGFNEIASAFENIGRAEVYHEKRYEKLLKEVQTQELLKKNDLVVWKCTNCGYHITGKEAPKTCPACGHDKGYFIEVSDILF
ncbi:MAG TPA: rubrerythrin family protein [Rickettsiales bacterium]|nr:rubrerythrin family protein [Rickettsiales bacterium]